VSEPVGIRWKEGRDLTGGLLGMVLKAWEAEKHAGAAKSKEKSAAGLTPEQKLLKRKIENTGMGGLSFFAWFGFIGRKVSAEESAEATAKEREKRKARKAGKTGASPPESDDGEEDGEDEDADDEVGMSLEIFPDGDDLAVAFTEDLWPGAIKYFSAFHPLPLPLLPSRTYTLTSHLTAQAQEQDALSDADFESDDDGDDGDGDLNDAAEHSAEESEDDGGRPAKKMRSS
jgi:hypothetical protein